MTVKVFLNLLKKNLVLAFSGAWTRPSVQGSSNFGFIIGAWEKNCPPMPESLQDFLTWALASMCSSSLVFLLGIYDFRCYKIKFKLDHVPDMANIFSWIHKIFLDVLTIALILLSVRLSMLSMWFCLLAAKSLTIFSIYSLFIFMRKLNKI